MEELYLGKSNDPAMDIPEESHQQVIDESVRHLNILINGNISLQEIIISILGRKIQNEFELLQQIHTLNRRLTLTTEKFSAKIDILKRMREIEVGDNIFKRLYCRLLEKLSRKFALFQNYRRKLSFIGSSIKLLYSYYQQSSLPQTQAKLLVFVEVLKIIIEENSQLYQLLLDLLVSQNFVSSIDQFNLLGIQARTKSKAENNEDNCSEQEIEIFGRRNRREVSSAQINDVQTRVTIEELFKRLKDHNQKTFRSQIRSNNLHKSTYNKNRGTSKIYNSLEKLFLQSISSNSFIKQSIPETFTKPSPKPSNPTSSRKISKFHDVLIQFETLSPIYDQQKKSNIRKVSNQNLKSLNTSNRGLYTSTATTSTKRHRVKVPVKSAFGKCLSKQNRPSPKPIKRKLLTEEAEIEYSKKLELNKTRLYRKYKTMIDQFVEQIDETLVQRNQKENYILQTVPQKQYALPNQIQGLLTVRKFKSPKQGQFDPNGAPDFSTVERNEAKPYSHQYSKSSHLLKRRPNTQRQIKQSELQALDQNRLRKIRALKSKLIKSHPKFQIFCPRQLKVSVRGSNW